MNNPAQTYRRGLRRFLPHFLVLAGTALLSLAFYRLRAHALLPLISPDLASGAVHDAYLSAAFLSDLPSTALALAILAAAWLLSPFLGALAAAVSLPAALAYSLFMVVATDFLRVYQTAFDRNFIGAEHFTGIKSMLISATAEISPPSRIALAVILVVLAPASIVALAGRTQKGKAPESGVRRGLRRRVWLPLALVLAASLFSATMASGLSKGRLDPQARLRGEELGANPVSALLFGSGKGNPKPSASGKATPSTYSTDSLESPGADRFLPRVKRGRYNVILYFFESTSWAYYSLVHKGVPVLPAMRRLAGNGLLLSNHYSNYPLSANTLYSVMSSRYSMYGRSMIFHEYHDADVNTITEVLSARGYASCLIHTGDLLYASRNKFLANRDIGEFILYKDLKREGGYPKDVGWGADERLMVKPALRWIKERSSPYLLIVAPVNPHHPYAVPDDFPRIADPEEAGIREGERTWRNYLNSLHYADAAMGQLVDALEAEGLMKDTLFVMVTDHGEAFHQHRGNYNHPLFIYEENVHVPALFYSKALFPTGVEMKSVTRHVDIMPSILDLLGVRDATPREGESLFSPSKEKMAVVHTSWNDEFMGIRDGRWKYIERMKDSREELYDLEADPGEKDNVAEGNPSVAARYRKAAGDMVSHMLEQDAKITMKAVPVRQGQ
jgi:arylsulfatase A-like enzyme